ncbi:putative amidohydrolase [Gordonia spumicola]|uniref:Putative amidohydrolase n=1 Tax=Gordonia spumicola TaxID=589161 RepID=A0A7I9VEE3_9ACTN|nr:amidohydrolase [Gordonia spumicola]GEE03655.1 putative amidohydrolase [Gordonia spumicola]
MRIGTKVGAMAAVLALSLTACSSSSDDDKAADIVFTGGKVYTVEPGQPWAQAVAVRDGKIVYVGDDAGAREYEDGAEVVDLKGRMLTPGFVDGHNHAYLKAESIFWANVTDGDVKAKQQALRDFRAEHPDAEQIRAVGWDTIADDAKAAGTTPRELIDGGIKDIPVAIISNDHHTLFANTAALQRAGLTKDTPQPAGGTVVRDAKGEPNGVLQEFGAQNLVISKLPQSDFTVDEYKQTILEWQKVAAKDGITSTFVPIHYPTETLLQAFSALDEENKLTVRFDLAQWVDETKGTSQIDHLVKMRDTYKGDHFALDSVKIFADGVGAPKLVWDQKVLNETVAALDKQGFRIYTHAIGSPGFYPTAAILDAYEFASKTDPEFATKRHAITHADWFKAADIERAKRLGILMVPQPPWFGKDWYDKYKTLPEYVNAMRYRSLVDAGLTVVGSSDFPSDATFATDMYVPTGLEVGVTRLDPVTGKPGQKPLNPAEQGTLAQLLTSYTINGAKLTFTEDERGSIKVGKYADLTVLDKNLFDVAPTDVGQVKVDATYFEGNVTYQG